MPEPKNRQSCEHEDFMVDADVNRITKEEGGPVEGFALELHVHCTQCEEPFVFRGVPIGLSPARPTMSPLGDELRVPILPQSADPTFGLGLAGFSMRIAQGDESTDN